MHESGKCRVIDKEASAALLSAPDSRLSFHARTCPSENPNNLAGVHGHFGTAGPDIPKDVSACVWHTTHKFHRVQKYDSAPPSHCPVNISKVQEVVENTIKIIQPA